MGTTNTAYEIAASGGSTTDSLIDAQGSRLATKTGSAIGWTLSDLHGNLVGDENASNTILDAFRYDAYGETVCVWPETPSGVRNAWRYQGRLDVSPTDQPLYAAGARLYAPSAGTFTSLDTYGGQAANPRSMNRFLYAEANPVTFIDPSGHCVATVTSGNGYIPICNDTGLPAAYESKPKGVVTLDEARQVFVKERLRTDIAWRYISNGCFAKAHLMVEDMLSDPVLKEEGVEPRKIWSWQSAGPLLAWHYGPGRSDVQTWKYHVAPTLEVMQPDGDVITMVIDPTLFDRVVTKAEWQGAQEYGWSSQEVANHRVQITKLGKPDPITGRGHGYWSNPRFPDPTYADEIGMSGQTGGVAQNAGSLPYTIAGDWHNTSVWWMNYAFGQLKVGLK